MKCFLFLLLLASAAEAQIKAFTRLDKSYSTIQSNTEIQNMPRVASQDGLGICYAYMTATLMQFENCKKMKQDCSALPEEELFSPLDLTRYNLKGDKSAPDIRSSYAGLKGVLDGGNAHNTAIIAALKVKKSANEACLSLDRVLSKMNSRGESDAAKAAMWQRLQNYFNRYKQSESCPTCLDDIYATAKSEIDKNLNIKAPNEQILRAFAQESFDQFLDELLGARKCTDVDDMAYFEGGNLEYEMWPKDKPAKPNELKDKIKEVLRTEQRPIALGNLCLNNGDPNHCNQDMIHGVVIAGYRQICKPSGQCRESFKVVNSWGKSWQDQNDGGWVDADALTEQVMYEKHAIGWFKDKQ